jgi:hypothetical protein
MGPRASCPLMLMHLTLSSHGNLPLKRTSGRDARGPMSQMQASARQSTGVFALRRKAASHDAPSA